ncbi:putative F-box/FBD/LRR-repeat protein At4g03220 [Papaver somniferum]|uniref:putative F-box/FBD/LRR-repeat protein At4g03220 n=1 Tax=Papaver somniferum TaxID=3469 RepID=UPI000E704F13|nr:putative F-box/FBD/LRR-repeat protein At4g03220 [Papaver somniferum]
MSVAIVPVHHGKTLADSLVAAADDIIAQETATAHVDHGEDKIRKSTLTYSLVAAAGMITQETATAHVDHEEDKISDLPDELIHHILSFLPIKYYMSTSILSKRWKYLSDSIHTLDFREWLTTEPEKRSKTIRRVKICAPNLSTISYTGEIPADFVIGSFPSLVEAVIDIPYTAKRPKTFVLFKLFGKVSNVKLLKIFGDSFLVPREAEILLTNLRAFNNLIHLEVGSDFTCTSFASASGSTLRISFRLLELSPYLESVVIAKASHPLLFGKTVDSRIPFPALKKKVIIVGYLTLSVHCSTSGQSNSTISMGTSGERGRIMEDPVLVLATWLKHAVMLKHVVI